MSKRFTFALALSISLPASLALAASPALADRPTNAEVTRDGAGNIVVSWVDGNPVDVFVSDKADATFTAGGVISAADRDGREVIAKPGLARLYFVLRDTRSGETTRVAERMLPLAQGSNFRDIGGYATGEGRHVKWGLIYRSGASPLLTEGDVAQVKALGLVDMIDLRSSEERVLAPTRLTGIRYTSIDYSMMSMMPTAAVAGANSMYELYRKMPAFLTPQLRIVFDDLLRRKGPIMYHCSAGQDRTGLTTAVVLSALGVPRATIIADYHLSTRLRRPEFEMPPISPAMAEANPVARMFAGYQKAPGATTPSPLKTAEGKAYLEGAFAEIDSRWGGVDGYLTREIGLTPQQLKALRLAYTE